MQSANGMSEILAIDELVMVGIQALILPVVKCIEILRCSFGGKGGGRLRPSDDLIGRAL